MRLLGYSGWLLGCCYVVAKLFWMVTRVLWLPGYLGWLLGQLLGYPGWLLGCCCAVARVLHTDGMCGHPWTLLMSKITSWNVDGQSTVCEF